MSLTETGRVEALAGALFDRMIVPMARSRRDAGQPGYFPVAPDPKVASYYETVEAVPAGRAAAVDFPGGGRADGLITALAAAWMRQDDPDLAALAPRLQEIAEALRAERGQESSAVDIYCYTMF